MEKFRACMSSRVRVNVRVTVRFSVRVRVGDRVMYIGVNANLSR